MASWFLDDYSDFYHKMTRIDPEFGLKAVTGLSAEGIMTFNNKLPGNLEVIGVHLHTGKATVNGPINIAFCDNGKFGNFPTLCGPASTLKTEGDFSTFEWKGPKSMGGWELPVVGDVLMNHGRISGATSLADGAPTTHDEFFDTLFNKCTKDDCPIYLNVHTKYSATMNGEFNFGAMRGQLEPKECPSEVKATNCWGVTMNTENTNKVLVPHPTNKMPNDTATMTAIPGNMDVLVMYSGATPSSIAAMELVNHDNSNFFSSSELGMSSYLAVLSFLVMTVFGLVIKLKNDKPKKTIKEKSSNYGAV